MPFEMLIESLNSSGTAAISVVIFIVCAAIVLFGSFFTIKEKSYEEAMAENRSKCLNTSEKKQKSGKPTAKPLKSPQHSKQVKKSAKSPDAQKEDQNVSEIVEIVDVKQYAPVVEAKKSKTKKDSAKERTSDNSYSELFTEVKTQKSKKKILGENINVSEQFSQLNNPAPVEGNNLPTKKNKKTDKKGDGSAKDNKGTHYLPENEKVERSKSPLIESKKHELTLEVKSKGNVISGDSTSVKNHVVGTGKTALENKENIKETGSQKASVHSKETPKATNLPAKQEKNDSRKKKGTRNEAVSLVHDTTEPVKKEKPSGKQTSTKLPAKLTQILDLAGTLSSSSIAQLIDFLNTMEPSNESEWLTAGDKSANQVQNLKKQVADLESQLINERVNSEKKSTERITKLIDSEQKATAKRNQLQQDYQALMVRMKHSQDEHLQDQTKQQEKHVIAADELVALKSELIKTRDDAKTQSTIMVSLQNEIGKIQEELSRAKSEGASSSNKQRKTWDELSNTKEVLRTLSEENNHLKAVAERSKTLIEGVPDQKVMEENKQLVEKVSLLSKLQETLKNQNDALQDQNRDLCDKEKSLRDSNEVQVSSLKAELDQLRQTQSDGKDMINDLEDSVIVLKKKNDELRDRNSSVLSALRDTEKNMNETEAQLTQLKSQESPNENANDQQLKDLQEKFALLESEIAEMRESNDVLTKQCEDYQSVLNRTEDLVATLEISVETEESKWLSKHDDLLEELDSFKKRLVVAEDGKLDLEERNNRLTTDLSATDETLSQLNASNSVNSEKLKTLELSDQEKSSEITRLKELMDMNSKAESDKSTADTEAAQKLEDAVAKIKKLENDVAKSKKKAEEKKLILKESKADLKATQRKLQDAVTASEDLQKQVDASKDGTQARYEELAQTVSDLSRQLEGSKQDVVDKNGEVKALKTEVESLRRNLSDSQSHIEAESARHGGPTGSPEKLHEPSNTPALSKDHSTVNGSVEAS